MIKHKNNAFTVVETMIFLAVSGFLFFSVALLISGQLEKSQSKDSINQLESVARGVLNDVSNGYYPENSSKFTCTGGTATTPPDITLTGTTGRGTLTGCILVGKKLTFGTNSLAIDTIVASKKMTALDVNAFAPTTVGSPLAQLQENKDYKWQIKNVDTTTPIYYVLNTSYGADTTSGSSFVTGSQAVSIFKSSGGVLVPASSEKLCFSRDDMKKYSLILAKDGALTVDVDYQPMGC